MKPNTTLVTLLLAALLAGCGVKEDEHQRVLNDLENTKQALEHSQSEKRNADAEVSKLKRELQALTEEVERLKSIDRTAFATASSISDRGRRKDALGTFIESYPQSTLVSDAQAIIARIDEEIEREANARREEQARRQRLAEEERQREQMRLRALAERVRSGNSTGQELSEILVGRSQADVIGLLGKPYTTHENGTVWLYERVVLDPISGNRPTLRIWFEGQTVDKLSW